MKMAVFWVVAPCSLVVVYRCFRSTCCLHHQVTYRPDDGGSKYLYNVGKLLPDYTTLQARRQPSPAYTVYCKFSCFCFQRTWSIQTPDITSSESHVYFPLLRSFQRARPCSSPIFRNMSVFMAKLAPPNPQVGGLSIVGYPWPLTPWSFLNYDSLCISYTPCVLHTLSISRSFYLKTVTM
jgi:hypothetical protein